VWVLSLAAIEWVRRSSRMSWEMELRQVLASFRKLCNDATFRVLKAHSEGVDATSALSKGFEHPVLMSELMGAIFYVMSGNNRDLERHLRVTFMELEGEALWIRYWANTDNERPTSMSLGHAFQRGEGVAGQAWLRNAMVVVPDVELDMRKGATFVAKTAEHQKYSIKSMVSIPVELPYPNRQNQFIGVLNIDSDRRNFFSDSRAGRRHIEVIIRPYVRIIRALCAAREVRLGPASG